MQNNLNFRAKNKRREIETFQNIFKHHVRLKKSKRNLFHAT